MSAQRRCMLHLACVAMMVTLPCTTAVLTQCSSPDVTYRDFRLSGSHNKTGVWTTTLGNIKVAIEHAGTPVTRSVGAGYWEVNVKISSTGCRTSQTEDNGNILEVKSSSEKELSISTDADDVPQNDQVVATEGSTQVADTYETSKKRKKVNVHDPFSNMQSVSAHDDGGDDERDVMETGVQQLLLDNVNQLPERVNRPESTARWRRPRYQPRYRNDRRTEYVDMGEAGVIKLFSDSLPWHLAKDRCETDGAHLVAVDSQVKVKALLDLFSRYPRVPRMSVLKNQAYTGVNDRLQEGVFTTVTGSKFKPWNESVWKTGEPNNAGGDEDCVTFHTEGRLRDVSCHFNLPFFCQLDDPSLS